MKPKKFFTFCAVGVNLKNEISSIYGSKIAEDKEYVIGFATTSFINKYNRSPSAVDVTEESLKALLKANNITQITEDDMDFDFLKWYGWAYCREDFDSIALYEEHKKVAYSGWAAARDARSIVG